MITGYKWELYNVMEDPTQSNDLAATMPDKLKQMQDLFYSEARKYNVLAARQLDARALHTPRPSLTAGRTELHLHRRTDRRADSAAPRVFSTRRYTITAEVEIPQGGAEGMIVTRRRTLWRLRPVPEQG